MCVVLVAKLPRTDAHHELENNECFCDCQLERIGEDVTEILD